jgi:hypothetical protein
LFPDPSGLVWHLPGIFQDNDYRRSLDAGTLEQPLLRHTENEKEKKELRPSGDEVEANGIMLRPARASDDCLRK